MSLCICILICLNEDQHMQMKQELQERHRDIANHVGQDVRIFALFVLYLVAQQSLILCIPALFRLLILKMH